MAMYSVYDNILMKLENVFLKVEMQVDKEISSLLLEHSKLNQQLIDLKEKIELLTSLKRSFELYCDSDQELKNLNRALFQVLCEKQVSLRFLQEKEVLLYGYLLTPAEKAVTVIQLNRELKQRKKLQEIELLSGFLADDPRFQVFLPELEQANAIFDSAIESGASDKLEHAITIFHNYFEKVINIYDMDVNFIEEFREFREQILLQAKAIESFTPDQVDPAVLQHTYKKIREQRVSLEREAEKLLFQFSMLQNGKKIIFSEIRNTSGELESVLFKEYAIKQKIQELRQYKIELNNQKDSFMKDPTVDGYTEAVQQLENVENRFRRLVMPKNFDKPNLASRFFTANKFKTEQQIKHEECSPYNRILFQALHNNHISSLDKMIILRLSKPSKLLNTHSGRFFFQRTGKGRSLQNLEKTFKKIQTRELH